jgi:hypothetical protein
MAANQFGKGRFGSVPHISPQQFIGHHLILQHPPE